MSTRSLIALQIDEDKYESIYCHSDGYLTHNGIILHLFYQNRKKIEELLELGNISVLAEHINPNPKEKHSFALADRQDNVVVAYNRDRGEKGNEKVQSRLLQILNNKEVEYIYIFSLENNWTYCHNDLNKHFTSYDKLPQFTNVKDDIEAIFEGKTTKEKVFSGFFSEQEIDIQRDEYLAKQKTKKLEEEM